MLNNIPTNEATPEATMLTVQASPNVAVPWALRKAEHATNMNTRFNAVEDKLTHHSTIHSLWMR